MSMPRPTNGTKNRLISNILEKKIKALKAHIDFLSLWSLKVTQESRTCPRPILCIVSFFMFIHHLCVFVVSISLFFCYYELLPCLSNVLSNLLSILMQCSFISSLYTVKKGEKEAEIFSLHLYSNNCPVIYVLFTLLLLLLPSLILLKIWSFYWALTLYICNRTRLL